MFNILRTYRLFPKWVYHFAFLQGKRFHCFYIFFDILFCMRLLMSLLSWRLIIPHMYLSCKQLRIIVHLFAFYFSMFLDHLLCGKTYKVSRLWIWKRSIKRGRWMQFAAAYLWVAGSIMTAYSRYSHGFP